ncbi:MAG TPA: chaplin family protein [Streptosporangiaceae bacterium]|jgi:hypothetical protein
MRKTRIVGAILAGAAAVTVLGAPAFGDTVDGGGQGSILGGNQIVVPVNIPVNACGNGLGILGQGNGAAECTAVGANGL